METDPTHHRDTEGAAVLHLNIDPAQLADLRADLLDLTDRGPMVESDVIGNLRQGTRSTRTLASGRRWRIPAYTHVEHLVELFPDTFVATRERNRVSRLARRPLVPTPTAAAIADAFTRATVRVYDAATADTVDADEVGEAMTVFGGFLLWLGAHDRDPIVAAMRDVAAVEIDALNASADEGDWSAFARQLGHADRAVADAADRA
jgi:hypothetical protein